MGVAAGGSFVPNNIQLGGQAPGFIVLTGPNMGGKSTLLRQVPGLLHASLESSWLVSVASSADIHFAF